MKILFILPWVPYPLDSGGNQAFFNMLDVIRKSHSVSLVTYTHSSAERDAAKELQKVWPDVKIECYSDKHSYTPIVENMSKADRRKCGFYSYIERSMQRKKARILRKYEINAPANSGINEEHSDGFSLGGFVRENSTLFRDTTDLNNGFLDYIYKKSREGFDIVQVEFFEYLPLVYVLPENVRKVFVHHELRFVRNENETLLFDKFLMNDNIKLQKSKDAEISMLARFNDIIVLTDIDKNILKQYLPYKNIYVSPALTSASDMAGRVEFHKSRELVFVGGGGHFPNADGMLWFAMEVVPKLKEVGFYANINVVGRWGDDIQYLIHQYCPDIKFVGFVDDLYNFVNGKISIVPIRIGSGMRMKIIDAMAANSPMVTTAKGCEGLPLIDGEDCYIANDAETFAKRIMQLQTDVELQKRMTTNTLNKITSVLDAQKLLNTRLGFYV